MSIQENKAMKLKDGKILYGDLRTRVEDLNNSKADAITNTVSGKFISFNNGADDLPVNSLSVAIEPVQDLHGYDHPWPAGGGKNKLKTSGLVYAVPSSTAFGVNSKRTFVQNSYCHGLTYNNAYQVDKATGITVSENLVRFTTSAIAYGVNIPVIGLTVGETYSISAVIVNGQIGIGFYAEDGTFISGNPLATNFTVPEGTYYSVIAFQAVTGQTESSFTNIQLESGSTVTSFSPYSNICPISGWTGAKVTRTGKNLLDESTVINRPDNQYFLENLKHNTDYVFSTDSMITGLYVAYSDSETRPDIIGTWESLTYKYNTTSLSFNSGTHKWYRLMSYENNGVTVGRKFQLELGSTATAYEPYQGQTYDITFPSEAGTVYGGSLDVTSGVLTIDRYYLTLANSKSSSYHSGTTPSMWIYFADNVIADASTASNCITNMYVVGGSSVPRANLYGSEIDVYDSRFTDETTARELLSDFVAVYKLHRTKIITIQLDPVTLSTLIGTNNIWADSGDVSVQYRADTKTYVDDAIPVVPVQDVQVNGTSMLTNGVANVPIGGSGTLGVVKTESNSGLRIDSTTGQIYTVYALASTIKNGVTLNQIISPGNQHQAMFYGLAKVAGADEKNSTLPVGQYTDNAKASIKAMLGIQDGSTSTVDISGTTPTITAVENTRYVCGEVTSLNFTPPASGISIVRFTSGSTVTVLTIPNTVKFPEWFDPTSLETNTIYEICVTDGTYGAVMSWAL